MDICQNIKYTLEGKKACEVALYIKKFLSGVPNIFFEDVEIRCAGWDPTNETIEETIEKIELLNKNGILARLVFTNSNYFDDAFIGRETKILSYLENSTFNNEIAVTDDCVAKEIKKTYRNITMVKDIYGLCKIESAFDDIDVELYDIIQPNPYMYLSKELTRIDSKHLEICTNPCICESISTCIMCQNGNFDINHCNKKESMLFPTNIGPYTRSYANVYPDKIREYYKEMGIFLYNIGHPGIDPTELLKQTLIHVLKKENLPQDLFFFIEEFREQVN